jgi:hypothetical protein
LQFPKKDDDSQVFPEMGNRVNDSSAEFIFDEGLFRRWPHIGKIKSRRRPDVIVVAI